ncbi:hypothetical protein GQ600_10959 [Phytophthora cactorum]|nr:hypothetical protein GQ600_10959 [Phytophthora cactorum]
MVAVEIVSRGRRTGHQNYNIPEQMLLLAMVDKYKPTEPWAPSKVRKRASTVDRRPDGPNLERDPKRVAADIAELNHSRNLNTTSSHLGGTDLRVLRPNIDEMRGHPNNNKN